MEEARARIAKANHQVGVLLNHLNGCGIHVHEDPSTLISLLPITMNLDEILFSDSFPETSDFDFDIFSDSNDDVSDAVLEGRDTSDTNI